MANIGIVGCGAVGTEIALQLQERGHSITMVAREIAGQLDGRVGTTTERAAGIGCIFKPSSQFVSKLVLDSYEDWMSLARNPECKSVMVTDLRIVTEPNENPSYAPLVQNFVRLDETTAQYTTYSLNPRQMLESRICRLRDAGAQFQTRSLTADEIKGLKEGVPLEGTDFTVEAIGLAARDIHPELDLYPIAGVLVHYIDPSSGLLRDSYMDEAAARYVVTRPSPHGREIILGGTFLEGVGSLSEIEIFERAQAIIETTKSEFSTMGLDLSRLTMPRETSVGFRPGRQGEPVIQYRGKVVVVTGFGGQGIVTNPALGRVVTEGVCDQLIAPGSF